MTTGESQVTLLLVEDDEVDVLTIERGLRARRIGNPVMRARDGREALELLQAGAVPAPYIVLLDLNLPRMSGLEFIEAVRTDEQLRAITIFVLTTSHDSADLLAAYQNHVAGYFLKERVGDEFMDLVDMLKGYWKIVCLPD